MAWRFGTRRLLSLALLCFIGVVFVSRTSTTVVDGEDGDLAPEARPAGLEFMDAQVNVRLPTPAPPPTSPAPTPAPFALKIVVLTWNRTKSLARALKSLEVDFHGDAVSLEIRIQGNHLETHQLVDGFALAGATATTVVRTSTKTLQDAWFTAWIPEDDSTYCIVVEDDIELAPAWYEYVKLAWGVYGGRTDLMGVVLNREFRNFTGNTTAKKPEGSFWYSIVNNNEPFIYPFVGTWGLSLHPVRWREFLTWVNEIKQEAGPDGVGEELLVPGIVPSAWWQLFITKKKTQSMWTMFMHKYVDAVRPGSGYLYVYLKKDRAFSQHYREAGEHYSGKMAGKPEQKVTLATIAEIPRIWPKNPPKYNWNACPVDVAVAEKLGLKQCLKPWALAWTASSSWGSGALQNV